MKNTKKKLKVDATPVQSTFDAEAYIESAQKAGRAANSIALSVAAEYRRQGLAASDALRLAWAKVKGQAQAAGNAAGNALKQGVTQGTESARTAATGLEDALQRLCAAQEAYAAQSGTWAGETAFLGAQWEYLGVVLRQLLSTVFLPVLHTVNAILAAMAQVAAYFFGTQKSKLPGIEQGAAAAKELQHAVLGAGESQKALGSASKKTASATKKTAKASQEVLASFDEINVLKQETPATGSGSTTGGGSAALPEIAVPNVEAGALGMLSAAVEKLKALLEPLQKINFDALSKAFERLKAAVAPMTQALFDGLRWAYENLFVPLAQWTIEDALPAFLNLLAGAADVLSAALEILKPVALWLWDNFLQPLAAWTGGETVRVLAGLAEALKSIAAGDWAAAGKAIIDGLLQGIGNLWELSARLCQNFINGFKDFFGIHSPSLLMSEMGTYLVEGLKNGVAATIGGVLTLFAWCWNSIWQLAATCWAQLMAIWQLVAGWFNTHVIEPLLNFFTTLWGALQNGFAAAWEGILLVWQLVAGWFNTHVIEPLLHFFTTLWGALQAGFAAAWEGILLCWQVVAGWFYAKVITPLTGFFTGLWGALQNGFSAAWEGVQSVWVAVSGWFNTNVVQPIAGFFTALWDGVKTTFTGAWDFMSGAFKGYINGWLGLIEGFGNFFVTMLNKIITTLNKIKIHVPDWEIFGDMAGTSFGFHIPTMPQISLPRLAQGAVIPPNAQFAAVLGDQRHGNNLEAPEALIRQIVREEGAGQQITIRFEGSMAQLARALQPALDTEHSRRGASLLVGG